MSQVTNTGRTALTLLMVVALGGEASAQVDRYQLRILTDIFDGSRTFSHMQTAAVARIREADEAYSLMDFGPASVVQETAEGVVAEQFDNLPGIDAVFHYDYASHTLGGDNAFDSYFNTTIRPYLASGPALGTDARWSIRVALADISPTGTSGEDPEVELWRQYFEHDGVDMVLVGYRVPAFGYQAPNGEQVVQWGEGVSVSDPGFAKIHWNGAWSRAVADDGRGEMRPYRFNRTIAAIDETGNSLFDPRRSDVTGPYFDRIYNAANTDPVPFVTGSVPADQTPVVVAAALDAMGLSLAENSANKAPEVNGQVNAGQTGLLPRAESGAWTVVGVYGTVAKFMSALRGLDNLNVAAFEREYAVLLDELAGIDGASSAYANEAKNLDKQAAVLRRELRSIETRIEASKSLMQDQIRQAGTIDELLDGSAARTFDVIEDLTEEARALTRDLQIFDNRINELGRTQGKLDELSAFLARNVDNLSGKMRSLGLGDVSQKLNKFLEDYPKVNASLTILGGIGNINETYQTAQNLGDFDPSDKDLKLSGSYDSTTGFVSDIALNILGIAGNAAQGNAVTTMADVATFASGRFVDLYKAYQAASFAEGQARQAHMDYLLTLMRYHRLVSEKQYAEWKAQVAGVERDLAELGEILGDHTEPEPWTVYHPNWDPETNGWREGTPQWHDEQERIRQEKLAAERRRQERLRDEIIQANERLAKEFEPDYPTADPTRVRPGEPRDPDVTGQSSELPPEILAEINAESPQERARRELEAYQNEKLAQLREEAERRREQRRAPPDGIDLDAGVILTRQPGSPLEIDPVVYDSPEWDPPTWNPPVWDPPTWEPPEWVPPEWVPPEFEGPGISEIGWTDFADDDWVFNTNNLAFQYGDMSGKVETDLGKWADWLETQDVRRLTRLALGAGYPNLASALADASSILRLSRDSGYRQWATQAPSCGGYIGCGPSYLERWGMKRSIVALGDLLEDQRFLESTGGLSDITISGTLLSYVLRDFGVEDGDIVDLRLSQFGSTLSTSRLSLLNAGTAFRAGLRPGVASLRIEAVNEGTLSPNTAEVRIDNVTVGDAAQSYSLLTGEVATLRIQAGAP